MTFRLLILLLCLAMPVTAAELPQSVYDQWADPSVAVINMPAGSYTLRHNVSGTIHPLQIKRSNVTVNFAGCTLLVNPSEPGGSAPVQVLSTSLITPTFPPPPSATQPARRYISRLIGVITTGTTQLTMATNEIVPVQPGETVLIWAGVTPSDPVEPKEFIPATVASVNCNTGLITFTAPLGKNITQYVNRAGLEAATTPGLHWKIGDWGTYPSDSNFSKGYGEDHGMERFASGMVGNVTFNNLTMELDRLTVLTDMPNTMWDVSAIAVNALTINNASVKNPHGHALHLWRSMNVTVNGLSVTGYGIGKIWNTSKFEAVAVAAWGGDNLVFTNLSILGTNIVVCGTEVGLNDISFGGLNYDVVFTDERTYGTPAVFSLEGLREPAVLNNVSVKATTVSGTSHIYFSYSPTIQEGYLRFPGSALTAYFDWGYQRSMELNGTVGLGGIEYGPKISVTNQVTVMHGQAVQTLTMPEGIYTAARFKVVTPGDMRVVSDSFGNSYWSTGGTSGWILVNQSSWHQIPPGTTPLANYMTKKLNFWMNNAGSLADGTVTLEYTYLPRI